MRDGAGLGDFNMRGDEEEALEALQVALKRDQDSYSSLGSSVYRIVEDERQALRHGSTYNSKDGGEWQRRSLVARGIANEVCSGMICRSNSAKPYLLCSVN